MDLNSIYNIKPGIIWFGISGSWRKTNKEVEKNVREAVRDILKNGHGIVSGGALNVDYFATDEALLLDPTGERIKVYLPAILPLYAAHYRKRATEGVITRTQAEDLIKQLEKLPPTSLFTHNTNTEMNPKTYFERNTAVVNASDAILAFQVNDSEGVADTIMKAKQQGKPVVLKKYIIND